MMLRARETPDSIKAGVLSVMVHALLLGTLLISFNWKTTHPVSIAQVELWDTIPTEIQQPVIAPPEPVKPEPVPENIESEPIEKLPPPVPESQPDLQSEIAIEKKPVKQVQKKEPPKPDLKSEQARKKLLEQMRLEDLKSASKEPPKDNSEAMKKLQQALLSEDKAVGAPKASTASVGEVSEFKARIQAKIRGNVNKALCGSGNPELKFEIGLIPTGELSGSPKLVKSSGNSACDDAVDRAIRASEPLPLPADPALFSEFRNLKLTFRPNE
jgi:colicin import membrane protein